MTTTRSRRDFLRLVGGAAGATALPLSIRDALAISARSETGTIRDVQHVVILMQENRSFDHYFGALRGVRGFGDRFPIPLASGKSVWWQSDGKREIPPYHLDSARMNALLVPDTPHSYSDAQAAWNQGLFGQWPLYKTQYSMGHYRRADVPFQYALAEAFTICDAYHCSITAGTDPNRIVFWSGSSFDPQLRARGIDSTDVDSEPDNLRCWVTGALPEPGYRYVSNALTWPTIPDVLQEAGVSWRVYQDPNDNWTGAMHGCLAFKSFREAERDSPIYRNGMSHWSIDDLIQHVEQDTLPQVSWILPTRLQSEHPGAPSSPQQGGHFTSEVLAALTRNPEVWSKTALFLTFDENDGFFDHLPPPAPPSFDADGKLAGAATLDLAGHFFHDPYRNHLKREDVISGTRRPWGLGPRVPMYVISPWSRGGWVNSQVADHTSVGQFLERRFGVRIPAISPWHRAVCGDLSSAFDFKNPNAARFPRLPDVANYAEIESAQNKLAVPAAPAQAQPVWQEQGMRPSRALPYVLHVDARSQDGQLALDFGNTGAQGAVFQVYDRLQPKRIPRRYTVEAGKSLTDRWTTADTDGAFDLWVHGVNGHVRHFKGRIGDAALAPQLRFRHGDDGSLTLEAQAAAGSEPVTLTIVDNAYGDGIVKLKLKPGTTASKHWSLRKSAHWYDFTVSLEGKPDWHQRHAGRAESGSHGFSDPAMAMGPALFS
ncbi:phosphocholine-specific phospholipase C [Hydrocarboniphaga effusa]|uniref:phosphocholine-specific phospholipase C n=1 Tax=Hydrocarboniphaga effusa TaxID=243629 RepID=UPI0031382680